jgi:cytochrome c55X
MKYFAWCGVGLLGLGLWSGLAMAGEPSAARKSEIIKLLRQDCGSCHGMTLHGGLGPPLLPETLRDKDREGLQFTILLGRPGTPMPPWQQFLTEEEVTWLVDRLVEGMTDAQK